jgi:hypothetical protein
MKTKKRDPELTRSINPISTERLRAVRTEDIVKKACFASFGRAFVVNHLRSQIVEVIVGEALGPTWKWTAADWAGWDFESADGTTKLEVKQSAAKQTWTKEGDPVSKASFDIAARKGHYVGNKLILDARRFAAIYIFAHHPVTDTSADHRDPHQWQFYVVSETLLIPATRKTIALSVIRKMVVAVDFVGLAERVEQVVTDRNLAGH